MNKKVERFAILVVTVLLVCLLFWGQSLIQFFQNNFGIKNTNTTKESPYIYSSPGGEFEPTKSIWLWIKSGNLINESGTYYLEGFLGDDDSKPIKLQLGISDQMIGYALIPLISFEQEFPNLHTNWKGKQISELVDNLPSNTWIIAKVKIEEPIVTKECVGNCAIRLQEITRLLKNNNMLNTVGVSKKFDNRIEVGPASQILIESTRK